jgi:hypothetical protein
MASLERIATLRGGTRPVISEQTPDMERDINEHQKQFLDRECELFKGFGAFLERKLKERVIKEHEAENNPPPSPPTTRPPRQTILELMKELNEVTHQPAELNCIFCTPKRQLRGS